MAARVLKCEVVIPRRCASPIWSAIRSTVRALTAEGSHSSVVACATVQSMRYQLVLQMPAASSDFDELVALEGQAESLLGDAGVVDGHDLGSGEMNIFVLTDDPLRAFDRLKPLVAADFAAAYREVGAWITRSYFLPAASTSEFCDDLIADQVLADECGYAEDGKP